MSELLAIPFLVIGYLVGTIPTGWLVARARGVDIQKSGSGNIGATNVLRTLGVGPALFVVLMDPVKGALATALPLLLGMDQWTVAATGLAIVLGNNFNVFLGMRGGKGIATSMGVFLVVNPVVTIVAAVIGIFTIAIGRYVSLGSIVGMVSAPLFLVASGVFPFPDLALATTLALLALYRHRENLRRLAAGTERRLGRGASPR
ncbi:MAG: glycerol-3-phosphate 1-O-acyltransferase PlsY [Trueperaceae bacterium]|nr:glycerol-3-phosphate 1-O-acyltransferase PlsY [Trueperaceae bacterium]